MDSVLGALNTIGGALGIPAALLIGWIFLTTRRNSQRLDEKDQQIAAIKEEHADEIAKLKSYYQDELDKVRTDYSDKMDTIRRESAAEYSRIYDKLSQLASDVSFIRGRVEKQ